MLAKLKRTDCRNKTLNIVIFFLFEFIEIVLFLFEYGNIYMLDYVYLECVYVSTSSSSHNTAIEKFGWRSVTLQINLVSVLHKFGECRKSVIGELRNVRIFYR